MKPEGYKEVQILLKNGTTINLYMDQSRIDVMTQRRFIQARSVDNVVWIAPEDITGFEVIDNREEKIQTNTPESATV